MLNPFHKSLIETKIRTSKCPVS